MEKEGSPPKKLPSDVEPKLRNRLDEFILKEKKVIYNTVVHHMMMC